MKLKSAEECKDTYKRECKHIHIHLQEVTEAPKLNAPVVCMVWYPGLHYCPNHRTAPANEADIIRNKTAVTNQIHKQKQITIVAETRAGICGDGDHCTMGDIILRD